MIGGAGFAMMAWTEAKRRAEVPLLPRCLTPNREHAEILGRSSWRYYRILDLASTYWKNRCGNGDCYCARVRL